MSLNSFETRTSLAVGSDRVTFYSLPGGLRKIRWARSGMGKRGGFRASTYWAGEDEAFYML